MNFLTLCQTVRQKCGITGTGPTNVVSQTGEMQRIVDWVNEAWHMVQTSAPDLYFMEKVDTTLSTISKEIAVPDDFSEIVSLVLNKGGTKTELRYVPLKRFDEITRTDVDITAEPYLYTIKDSQIVFAVTPGSDDPLILTYTKKPTEMAVSSDEPDMPPRYHWLIVYKAMELYGFYENAQEIILQAKQDYAKMYRDLQRSQRDPMRKARPLV